MRFKELIIPFLCVLIGFTACKKDDDPTVETIPPRDRGEQQMADNDSIVKYLKSHYYNASVFEANTNPSYADLIISKIDGDIPDPGNNKRLFGAVALDSIQIVYADTDYNIYYLKLNIGGGQTPTFADNVRVNYEGFTLSNNVFDSSVNPVDFDLAGGTISGWGKVIPKFKTSATFTENEDGTVTYANHGVGVMFIPSGLAYFSEPRTGFPAYSPLIFKFDLFEMEENDHDNDGIPSYLEDLDGDGDLFDENTDGDFNPNTGVPLYNFLDSDDDNDGVPTKREDLEPDTDLNVDRDNDGDPSNDIGDGDPTNDIGKNGIPKYLDPEETEASKL